MIFFTDAIYGPDNQMIMIKYIPLLYTKKCNALETV